MFNYEVVFNDHRFPLLYFREGDIEPFSPSYDYIPTQEAEEDDI